jgi:division protein CdvB (Snf7/Vps24/ESCRT-III family)
MNVLALELLRTRKAVTRLHASKAQMNSVCMHLNENIGAPSYSSQANVSLP